MVNMPNLFNFQTVEQLHAFIREIKSLRELVKCPVCLEVTKNPVRIACNHNFCSSCLDSFVNTFRDYPSNKTPQCPVCRKAINRRRKPVNGYVESLLAFLSGVDAGIQSTFSCDILALTNKKDIDKLFKEKICSDSSSSIIESTSYQEDAFDKLLHSGVENLLLKGKYGKTYTRNPPKKETVQTSNKTKVFENKDTKTKIHQWLENTKNHFDRLTQTQCTPNDPTQTQASLNMPSVSQNLYGWTPKGKRPKSFELKPKVPIIKLTRHSFTGESQELDDDDKIEEVESEEIDLPNKEQVLRLLEEECLNSIDLELGVGNMKEEPKLKQANTKVTKNGWKRIKKNNRAINKSSRKKKMLDVTLISSVEKDNGTTKNTDNKQKIDVTLTSPGEKEDVIVKNPVVILRRFGSKEEYSNDKGKITKTVIKNKSPTQKGDTSMEMENNMDGPNNNEEDFVCSATRLSTKAHKLANNSVFSEDQCSVQCCKDGSHEICQKPATRVLNSKDLNINSVIEDAGHIIKKLTTVLRNKFDSIDNLSLMKLKTTLTDLNNVLSGTELNTTVSTQTIYFDMKSVTVQTESEEDKTFRSIDLQTDDFACCENCSRARKTNSTSNVNRDLTPTDVLLNSEQIRQLSKQLELEDIFEVKTQEVTQEHVNKEKTVRSPLVPTQKIDDKNNKLNSSTEKVEEPQNAIEEVTKSKLNENTKMSTLKSQISFSLSNHRINSKEECEEKIAQISKKFKRIRAMDLDSDEEGFAKKTKLENKYLADNLSIEMVSENVDEKDATLKPTGNLSLSLNNDVDYDAYLLNIMKRYEENPSGNKTKKPSENQPSTSKKTESQTIFDRCDAMIREVTTIKYPNKNDNEENDTKLKCGSPKKCRNEVGGNIGDITIRESPIDIDMLQEFDKPFQQKPSDPASDRESGTLPCTESFMANINVEALANSNVTRSDQLNTMQYIPILKENSKISPKKDSNVVILNDILLDAKNTNLHKEQEKDDGGSERSEELFYSENDELMDEDVIETTPKKRSQVMQRSFPHQLKRKSLTNRSLLLPPIDSPDVISSIDPTSFFNQTFTPPVDFQDLNNDRSNKNTINIDVNSRDFDDTFVAPDDGNKRSDHLSNKSDKTETELGLINPKDFENTMFTPSAINKSSDHTLVQNNTAKNRNYKLDLSLSESEVLRLICNSKSPNTNVITSTQKSAVNENFGCLGVSPIQKEKRRNPIEIAQQTKFSPLNVVTVEKPDSSKSLTASSLPTKQKSILSFVKSDKIDKNTSIISVGSSGLSPSPAMKPYVSCTRLSKEQMLAVSTLSKRKLIHYTNTFSPQVTHVIVSVNKHNWLEDHTMKLIMAIAHGKWVLGFDWIKECLAQNKIVPEEKYEALDMSGLPGPKMSRLKGKEKPLLQGYKIHLEPPFLSTTKQDIEELIRVLGGEVIPNIESFMRRTGIRLIITEAKSTQDYYKCEQWLQTYKVISVDIEWLSRSIGQYQLVSLRPFALCSDDNINSLGYPPELTVESSFSYSQSVYNK